MFRRMISNILSNALKYSKDYISSFHDLSEESKLGEKIMNPFSTIDISIIELRKEVKIIINDHRIWNSRRTFILYL